MAFNGLSITVAGLVKIELPARTLLLSDGGLVKWGSDVFTEDDTEFGSISALEVQRDGIGDLAPGGVLSFNPKSATAAVTLSTPAYQNSRMRFWLAEVTPATGEVAGTPELIFDGLLNTTLLRLGSGTRELDVEFMSRAEKLFLIDEGNGCTPLFHKSVWAGELGLDNANGAQIVVAWGTQAPPRGSIAGANAGGGFAPGGGGRPFDFLSANPYF